MEYTKSMERVKAQEATLRPTASTVGWEHSGAMGHACCLSPHPSRCHRYLEGGSAHPFAVLRCMNNVWLSLHASGSIEGSSAV